MKMKTTIAVFTGLMVAVNVFGQGQVIFRNTPDTAVVYGDTGLKVDRVFTAGLYYSTDLSANVDPSAGTDDLILAATTPVGSGPFNGVYAGGTVTIQGVDPGTQVLIQVRAWNDIYGTYAEAMAGANDDPIPLVGTSTEIGTGNSVMIVQLGGGVIPVPSLTTVVDTFAVTPVPEPSTLLLGLLGGLGAMVLLRRRK